MTKKTIFTIAATLVILAGALILFLIKSQKQTVYAPELGQTEFSDKEIIDFSNSDMIAPEHFFFDKDEEFLKPFGRVEYADQETDEAIIFYCLNNTSDAQQYVNKYIEDNINTYGTRYEIIGSSENHRFFEFKLDRTESSGSIKPYKMQYRIFKCAYAGDLLAGTRKNLSLLNRESIDNLHIGSINLRPITIDIVKEFSESMWSTGGFDRGEKVLSSFTEEQAGLFRHSIYEIMTGCLASEGGLSQDECTAALYLSEFTADKNSGEVYFSRNKIKEAIFYKK